jgi:hypothetical protein
MTCCASSLTLDSIACQVEDYIQTAANWVFYVLFMENFSNIDSSQFNQSLDQVVLNRFRIRITYNST